MDVVDALRGRRSITFFDEKRTVSEDVLKEILEVANLSPSSFNLQPWRVIIVRDAENKRKLRKCAADQSKIETAPAVLIIVADPDVEVNLNPMLDSWEELGYIRKDSRGQIGDMVRRRYGDADSVDRKLFAAKNAAIFAMAIMIAARGLGLETHAMDGFDTGPLKDAFAIPEDKLVIMLIAVGYAKPGVTLLPRAFRRPFQDYVSNEQY